LTQSGRSSGKDAARRRLLAIVKDESARLPDGAGDSPKSLPLAAERGETRVPPPGEVVTTAEGGDGDRSTAAVLTGVSLAAGFAGVSMSVLSFMSAAWEVEALNELAKDVGSKSVAHALAVLGAACLMLPSAVVASVVWVSDDGVVADLTAVLTANVPIFALLFLGLPHYISGGEEGGASGPAVVAAGQSQPTVRRDVGKTGNRSGSSGQAPHAVIGASFCARNAFAQYATVVLALPAVRRFASVAGVDVEPFSFSLWLATVALLVLLYANWQGSGDWSRPLARSEATGGGAGGAPLVPGRAGRGSQSAILQVRRNLLRAVSRVGAFIAQSRSHKASWQVFNFLVMQSSMVLVETTYAFMTDSVGLISISADNMFCCLALGAGLFAIRATGLQKRSVRFSFGLARLESLCGFVNGILLVVVALLLLLEAVDRVLNPELIDSYHIFAVCLFGILGNGLGLVFFPPESRRENHNVQSIYLHIWANTLAYAGISASAVVLGVNPGWKMAELVVAVCVAAAVVVCAVPLLVRSSRLLMNLPAAERVEDIQATRAALGRLNGVVRVCSFHAWNLTPTSMVLSAHLEMATASPAQEQVVLFQAQSLCAGLGAPVSQTTIQISREGDGDGDEAHVPPSHSRSLGSFDVESASFFAASPAPAPDS
jgi:cobalt-zinc-cadmium efflux system protein